MKKSQSKSKTIQIVFTIIGTILVLFPVVAPILFTLIRIIQTGFKHFNFDWLMPAELFPVALIGAIILIVISLIARSERAIIISGFALAAVVIVGVMAYTTLTGLASGETEPAEWMMGLLMGIMGIYSIAHIIMGVGGIMLVRSLRERK